MYTSVFAQKPAPCFYSPAAAHWADSLLNQMDERAKIGQLFMIDAFSNKDSAHVAFINQLIDSFQIGGLIFFQGGPVRQAMLTNDYQKRSKVPMLIGIDGEWGLSMRLDSTIRFPRQMTLAAGSNKESVLKMGVEIARQCQRLGIHINFAPDVDINNNPDNPIINSRSFGENKHKVAEFGIAYMTGLQQGGVLACAKHFPGHGDTNTDSHQALPLVTASKTRLDSLELFPFKKLINKGVASVMVAHLSIPELDTTKGLAASLSKQVVNDLLVDSLGFSGLIFTDALNMKGVADFYPSGELELKALLAGNDVLLYSSDVAKSCTRIHFAIQNCEIEQDVIDRKVKKILMAKYWAGLNNSKAVEMKNLISDLNSAQGAWLDFNLYDNAPTLLKNTNQILPLNPYNRDCFASIVLNDTVNNAFQQQLSAYAKVDRYQMQKEASNAAIDSLISELVKYDHVILSVHNTSINASKNFGLSTQMIAMIEKVSALKGSVVCVFGNPYILGKLKGLKEYSAIIEAYEDTYLPQMQVAQKVFGAMKFQGHLPVSVPEVFKLDEGLQTNAIGKLKFTLPEAVGMKSDQLNKIDSLVAYGISEKMFPGCQVVVAVRNNVIYNKSFGKPTYESNTLVKKDDVYDIASVTKIASTAIALMHLYDKHKIDPEARASKYLRILKHTNKRNITVKQLMAHEAGLQAWIPFWKDVVDSTGPKPEYFKKQAEADFTIQVADSLFLNDSFPDDIWHRILESDVEPPGNYVYSDLGIIILQKIVEKISGKPIDEYVTDFLYKPIGLSETGYIPRTWIKKDRIIPTEYDSAFRKTLVQGFVHDPAAAMMNGVAGHAGIFTSAQSLAVIMQMLLNKGEYGGVRFIKKETIEKFTAKAFPEGTNRRALIFDRPDAALGENGPTAISASDKAFGHAGFTGTCAWVDPKSDLIYIFLSNRVYPTATNNKLAKSNLRTEIMQVVYDAMDH